MRVLFVAYPHIGLNVGGLQIQIAKTAEHLRAAGVEVVYYDPWKNCLDEIDLVHIFSLHPAIVEFGQIVKSRSKPLVVSSVLNLQDRSINQLRIQTLFARYTRGLFTSINLADQLANLADGIIALTEVEKRVISKVFRVRDSKISVIPNGVDQNFSLANPDEFTARFGIRDFVLCVGKIEPRKNQLQLIKACQRGGWPLVLIGPPNSAYLDYFQLCQRTAKKNVYFVGSINHDDPLLASAYAASRVFALVSVSEVFPLTVLEAAISNTKVVLTRNTAMGDLLGDLIKYTETDEMSIFRAIRSVWELERSTELHTRVSSFLTWPRVVDEILNVYKDTIKNGTLFCA